MCSNYKIINKNHQVPPEILNETCSQDLRVRFSFLCLKNDYYRMVHSIVVNIHHSEHPVENF